MVELECLPLGVGNADDGVCLLLRMGPHRILLDCGLRDLSLLEAELEQNGPIELALCSHAHADHARGFLTLHNLFPHIPICASEVTTQLLPLNWLDTAAIDSSFFVQALPWRTPIEFRDGLTVELWPAGHLPGAAAALLTYTPPPSKGNASPRSYSVFYTGDFFLSNARLVDGLPLEEIRGLKPDVLIIEGTYGTARHPRRRQQENQLAERISRAISEQQSVLILTPFLGAGQELLMLLRSHHSFTGRDVDIWVDGTLANACDIYLDLLSHFPTAVQNFAQHQPLFWDDRVRPRVRRLESLEQAEQLGQPPCIVLTDRSDHLEYLCSLSNALWVVLLPQYGRADFTPPSSLENSRSTMTAVEELQFFLNHQTTASVETYFLADHSDGSGTMQLIHNLRPQHVVFVHGSSNYLADLTSLEELQNRYHLHCPGAGTPVELPIGDTFLQPSAPEGNFEGELTESGSMVTISIPDAITADQRWQKFADTGLVEVRWQGEELVLRGLSQWEILGQNQERLLQAESSLPTRECCGICRHYRAHHCWNPLSPLVNLRVPEDGFCPSFQPRPHF